VPDGPAETARCILDSLALAYRRAIIEVRSCPGGTSTPSTWSAAGSRNRLLCQLAADACGLPVVAGPAEATAIGNLLVQAAPGRAPGDLPGMRELIRTTHQLETFRPDGDNHQWRSGRRPPGPA